MESDTKWASFEAELPAELKAKVAEISRLLADSDQHQKSVLRRLGVSANLDHHQEFWLQLRAAARYMGISENEFWQMDPDQFCAVLEFKARELERQSEANRADPRRSREKASPKSGGRPKGIPVNGEKMRTLRGKLPQHRFAAECGVSLDTIQRGEAGERWDEKTFITVAENITALRRERVTPEDLKNRTN
jgi:hypothetical protein